MDRSSLSDCILTTATHFSNLNQPSQRNPLSRYICSQGYTLILKELRFLRKTRHREREVRVSDILEVEQASKVGPYHCLVLVKFSKQFLSKRHL